MAVGDAEGKAPGRPVAAPGRQEGRQDTGSPGWIGVMPAWGPEEVTPNGGGVLEAAAGSGGPEPSGAAVRGASGWVGWTDEIRTGLHKVPGRVAFVPNVGRRLGGFRE